MGEERDEDERRALEDKFYEIYRPLQKRHGLRYHMSFDLFGNNMIEIWEYVGEKKGWRICKTEAETAEECLRLAIGDLKWYETIKEIKNKEERENEKRAV